MPQGHVIDIMIIGFLQLTVLQFLKSENNLDVIDLFTCHFEIVVLSLCQHDHAPYFLYTGKKYLQ